MSDPIASMLTKIRNGLKARKDNISVPLSKTKEKIVKIMKDEGYIKDYRVIENDKIKKDIKVILKYGPNNEDIITGLRRISKPSLKVYVQKDELPRVMGGLGVAIISTSKGIMTEKQSRRENVGGEVMCYIW